MYDSDETMGVCQAQATAYIRPQHWLSKLQEVLMRIGLLHGIDTVHTVCCQSTAICTSHQQAQLSFAVVTPGDSQSH
jgi:hypothetical protein